MAFVRLLGKLLKDKGIGRHVVPIIPDEARTFGMEPLFRTVGIYAAHGQKYEPVDSHQLLYYRETKDGQVCGVVKMIVPVPSSRRSSMSGMVLSQRMSSVL